MKRAVARAKRRKTSTGAKRKAPRRRAVPKTSAASRKPRRPATKRKTAKLKVATPRPLAVKRKVARRKPRLKRLVSPVAPDETIDAAGTAIAAELESTSEITTAPRKVKPPATKARTPRKTAVLKSAALKKAAPRTVGPRTVRLPKLGLEIPAILLEGDEPETHAHSGPGEKFALGPETPAAHFATEAVQLPATYGTGRLFLTARDPHWLYAHWDINTRDQFHHNAKSMDRHLILRMHEDSLESKPVTEIHVHPESRHWFAHIESAGMRYVADLGYYRPGRRWKSLATSAPMRTPPDTISPDSTVEFATIPLELPFETMLALLKEGEAPDLPLAQGIKHLRAQRRRDWPQAEPPAEWTAEQEQALAQLLAAAHTSRAPRGSQEFAGPSNVVLPFGELPEVGGWLKGFAPSDLFSFSGGEPVSSPMGGGDVGQDFWFNVNAELTIYGATEPDAKVTIGGRRIALRPDGSFSFRFALPDGQYELPIVAVSADNTDGRAAELKFSRATEVFGHVGQHPQDPELKPPPPDNV